MDLLVPVVAGVITASVVVTLSGILNLELNDGKMSGGDLCVSKGYKWYEKYSYCGVRSTSICKELGGSMVCSEENNPFYPDSFPATPGRIEIPSDLQVLDPFPNVYVDVCIVRCEIPREGD